MNIREKHSLALRWLHWVNFPLLLLMVWSGMMIYWAWEPYQLGSWHFFPQSFFESLGLRYRLAEGISLHLTLMWFFAGNGILYVVYCLVSGQWRFLVPLRGSLRRSVEVILHDLRLGAAPISVGKYNDAQRFAYSAVIAMAGGLLLTGLAIYKPIQVGWLTALLGGYEWARAEHFALTLGVVGFFLIHVQQVVRAGWNNFRSMVTGFEVEDE